MNERRFLAPGRGAYRRSVVGSIVRSVLTVTLLMVVYYQAPLDKNQGLGIWFVAGLVGLAAALVWQVRSIVGSEFPRLRALEAVAVWVPALLILYASTYSVIWANDPSSFNQSLGRTAALYFTMTVFATVGFGDIVPTIDLTRIIVMTQMVAGLITVGVVVKVVLGAVQVAVQGRTGAPADPPPAARPDATTTDSPGR